MACVVSRLHYTLFCINVTHHIVIWSVFRGADIGYNTFWHFGLGSKQLFIASLVDPFHNISSAFCLPLHSMPSSCFSILLSEDLLHSNPNVNFDFQPNSRYSMLQKPMPVVKVLATAQMG